MIQNSNENLIKLLMINNKFHYKVRVLIINLIIRPVIGRDLTNQF